MTSVSLLISVLSWSMRSSMVISRAGVLVGEECRAFQAVLQFGDLVAGTGQLAQCLRVALVGDQADSSSFSARFFSRCARRSGRAGTGCAADHPELRGGHEAGPGRARSRPAARPSRWCPAWADRAVAYASVTARRAVASLPGFGAVPFGEALERAAGLTLGGAVPTVNGDRAMAALVAA